MLTFFVTGNRTWVSGGPSYPSDVFGIQTIDIVVFRFSGTSMEIGPEGLGFRDSTFLGASLPVLQSSSADPSDRSSFWLRSNPRNMEKLLDTRNGGIIRFHS